MDKPVIISNPDILKRRDVEFFIIDSLTNLVQKEMQKEQVDTQSLIASANLVTEIRELVIAADQAYQRGDKTIAEALYLNALELIPEIYKSHNYFMTQIDDIEDYRQKQVRYYLNSANILYGKREYEDALQNYANALEYLPSEPDTNKILTQIQMSGYMLESARTRQSYSAQARAQLEQGDKYMDQEDYNQAIYTYLMLIQRYPESEQVNTALRSISTAIDLMDQAFQQKIEELTANSGDQAAQIQEYLAEIEALEASLAEKGETISYLESRGGYSEGELEKVGKSIIDKSELDFLKNIFEEYTTIQTNYKTYTEKEDHLTGSDNRTKTVLGKSYLDTFLSSSEMESIFPGLIARIKKYDQAFEQMGRESAINFVVKVINNLSGYSTPQERLSYLDQEIAKAGSDELSIVLLRSLKDFISQ